jgi:hypothetical protein
MEEGLDRTTRSRPIARGLLGCRSRGWTGADLYLAKVGDLYARTKRFADAARPAYARSMILAVFRRRLRDGVSIEDFIKAWEADRGFGVPARVFNALSVDDSREVLSGDFVDIDASGLGSAIESVAEQEAVRHSRIDTVIESTVLRAYFDLKTEHDSSNPREFDLDSAESLLASFRGAQDA